MRILLTKHSKSKLCTQLKKQNQASSLKELSIRINIPKSTLENWFYNTKRYIPEKIIPKNLIKKLEILDKQQANWGNKKGGKKTYCTILKKYGAEEIKKRQIAGGKAKNKKTTGKFKIDINSPLFLEFYGALLGDGWLSALSYTYKTKVNLWWIGLSGNAKLDKQYLMYHKKNVNTLFKRKVAVKYKKDSKGMEIIFSHKQLILFMNKRLGFPIGKKINLKIEKNIAENWEKMKYVIKGIFDTDGSLYFDKTPAKKAYPIISLHMKAPHLLKQINKQLLSKNFKVRFRENELILKGSKQLNKWMNEIGSNNSRHFLKYQQFIAKKKSL